LVTTCAINYPCSSFIGITEAGSGPRASLPIQFPAVTAVVSFFIPPAAGEAKALFVLDIVFTSARIESMARSSSKNNSTANPDFEAKLWLGADEVRNQNDGGSRNACVAATNPSNSRSAREGLLPSALCARRPTEMGTDELDFASR
jgi:hypothetical protein